MVLDGLLGLFGLKYYCATAYGLPLYLCSYKLVSSATCDTDFEPGFNSSLCSDNSLRTPGMSIVFHAKIFLLSLKKLVSVSSYSLGRWALISAVLVGSQVPRSILMISKLEGGVMIPAFLVGISMSSGLVSCARLAISYASKACCALAVI